LKSIDVCLCGGKEFELIVKEDRYKIPVGVQLCRACGLGIQNPRPTDEALRNFYRADYRKLLRGTNKIDHDYFLRGHRRGQGISSFMEEHQVSIRNGVVVEVGCGPGGTLEVFREKDNEVWGCELDKKCVEYGNAQGIKILLGDVNSLAQAGVMADLVILSHLLEHVPSPIDFAKNLSKILKETGLIYIEVPGMRNPKKNFYASVQVAHLYYFDLVTLQYVMGKADFYLIAGNENVNSIFRSSNSKVDIQFENNFDKNFRILL